MTFVQINNVEKTLAGMSHDPVPIPTERNAKYIVSALIVKITGWQEISFITEEIVHPSSW
jgi:hypothetical protein